MTASEIDLSSKVATRDSQTLARAEIPSCAKRGLRLNGRSNLRTDLRPMTSMKSQNVEAPSGAAMFQSVDALPSSVSRDAPGLSWGWLLRRSALWAAIMFVGVFSACVLYGAASTAEQPSAAAVETAEHTPY